MPYCLVVGCHTGQKKPGIIQYQLFQLPEDKGKRTRWLNIINRDFVATPHSGICAKHFQDSDFIPEDENLTLKGVKKKYKTLKPNAVPSLYLKDPIYTNERSTLNSKTENPKTLKLKEGANLTVDNEEEPTDFEATESLNSLENVETNKKITSEHNYTYVDQPNRKVKDLSFSSMVRF